MKLRRTKIKSPGFNVPMDIPPPASVYATDFAQLKEHALHVIEEHYGDRCKTKDTDDFEELLFPVGDNDAGRCPICLVYEKFDKFWDTLYEEDDMEVS